MKSSGENFPGWYRLIRINFTVNVILMSIFEIYLQLSRVYGGTQRTIPCWIINFISLLCFIICFWDGHKIHVYFLPNTNCTCLTVNQPPNNHKTVENVVIWFEYGSKRIQLYKSTLCTLVYKYNQGNLYKQIY